MKNVLRRDFFSDYLSHFIKVAWREGKTEKMMMGYITAISFRGIEVENKYHKVFIPYDVMTRANIDKETKL